MKKVLLLIFGIILLVPEFSFAETIYLSVKLDVSSDQNAVEVKMTVTNKGETGAWEVFPTVRFMQQDQKLSPIPLLGTKTSHQWTCRFGLAQLGFKWEGTYPFFLKIHYRDSNQYPSSMPYIFLLHFKEQAMGLPIKGTFMPGKITGSGKAEVVISKPGREELSGTVGLFLPDELVSFTGEKPFRLAGDEKVSIPFEIENAGALLGSRYRVWAVVQTVRAGMHHTLILPEMVEIRGYMHGGKRNAQIAGGILFLLGLFFITIYLELRDTTRSPWN